MKVAYVVSRYPHISHTFIRREVEALRDEGVEVHTFTVRRSEEEDRFSAADREAAATTTPILPVPLLTLLRSHVTAIRRSPTAYVRTLVTTVRGAPTGIHSSTWAFFYFLEGIVLWWHCDQRGIRHVHAHFANVGCDVARVAARFGRGSDPDGRWSWSFTMHGYTEFSDVSRYDLPGKANDADAVVAISDFARSQLVISSDPPTWPRLHIVHCGIDVNEFSPTTPSDEPGPLRVLFLGRLVFEKGPVVLVEAVRLLRDSGMAIHLTLVGEGPARADIARLVVEAGLEANVTMVGAVPPDEAPSHYHQADVFCLPSFAEGLPVVLMEAMSCCLPVVTTYVNGIPELVTDGVEGRTVTPGRSDRIADALRDMSLPERRREMGVAGRKKVEREFDITMVGPELVAIFRTLPGT